MCDNIIALSSEDEDLEPAPKKRKITPNLPECTLTLVSTKPTENTANKIETVLLDSDDDDPEGPNNSTGKITNFVDRNEEKLGTNHGVDLINLTDDEDHPKTKRLKKGALEHIQETVAIDDSDTEIENKNIDFSEEKKTKLNLEKPNKNPEENGNHSIIIEDSDEETEKENHCEYEHIKTFPVHVEKTSATEMSSTSKDEMKEAKSLFKKFIRMIEEKIVDSSFEEILPKKVPIIQKYFNRSGCHVNDDVFKTLLQDSIESIRISSTANGANSAVLAFHKVFEHLKSHVAETTIIVEEDNVPKIKKLEQTIKLLKKRIHQLEIAEVNFDDDEDSAYIMLDKYQCRLKKVYAKYCQYIKKNPYSGRAVYDRITFVNSSYNEINQAISKKYKNSLVFPSYYELERFVTNVSEKEKLNLSENEIKIESKKCFKVLGNILQKKRRQELYDSHLSFIESTEDPATKDISLENILKKNYSEGKEKIDKLYQKYVEKQERGEDKVSTEEEHSSDNSESYERKVFKGKSGKNNKFKTKKPHKKKENQNKEPKNYKHGEEDGHHEEYLDVNNQEAVETSTSTDKITNEQEKITDEKNLQQNNKKIHEDERVLSEQEPKHKTEIPC